MRRFLILVVFLGFGQIANAQESGFSIGFGGSYDKHLNQYAERPWIGFNHEFADITAFTFGTQVNYQFSNGFGLRSGVSFARKGYKLVYQWIAPDGNIGIGDSAIPLESEFRLNYIDIPLSLYYQVFTTNGYSLAPSLGIMNSIKIGESEVSKMGDGTKKETTFNFLNANPYLVGARLGLINNFDLSSRIFISLEPYLTYNFSKISDTAFAKSDFVFGGYLSVNYRFNKK